MGHMVFDRSQYIIPPRAIFEDGKVTVEGDIVIADKSEVLWAMNTEHRIFVGEMVTLGGDLEAGGDIRIDMSCDVSGNIVGHHKVYVGPRCKIAGKLTSEGDLDIGEDVEIAPENLDAQAWVNIRDPIPTMIYIVIYLLELLRRGETEQVEAILAELEAENPDDFLITGDFLFVPLGSRLTKRTAQIKGSIRVGEEAKVRGNLNATKDVLVGMDAEVLGHVIAKRNVTIKEGAVIEGSARSKGDMDIETGVHITGDVECMTLKLHTDAKVDGTVFAQRGIRFADEESKRTDDAADRVKSDLEGLDTVLG